MDNPKSPPGSIKIYTDLDEPAKAQHRRWAAYSWEERLARAGQMRIEHAIVHGIAPTALVLKIKPKYIPGYLTIPERVV